MKCKQQRIEEKERLQLIEDFAKELSRLNPEKNFIVEGKDIYVNTNKLLKLKFPESMKYFEGDPEECECYGFVAIKTDKVSVTVRARI